MVGHVLNGDAVDARIRHQLAHRLHHVHKGVAHAGGVHDVQRHALHIGFVADVRRINFERHWKPQLGGNHHGFIGAARQDGFGDRNMESRQKRLGFHFGEHFAAFGQHAFNQQTGTFHVGLFKVRQRWRGLLEKLLVLVEGCDIAKRAHCRFGRAESGNGGVVQNFPCITHGGVAHPASQQRLAHMAVEICNGLGDCICLNSDLGRVNHQYAVDVTGFADRFNGQPEMLGRGFF